MLAFLCFGSIWLFKHMGGIESPVGHRGRDLILSTILSTIGFFGGITYGTIKCFFSQGFGETFKDASVIYGVAIFILVVVYKVIFWNGFHPSSF